MTNRKFISTEGMVAVMTCIFRTAEAEEARTNRCYDLPISLADSPVFLINNHGTNILPNLCLE